MEPDAEVVRYDEDDHVATATITSPPLNILTWTLREQILAAVRRAFVSPPVRVVCLISGAPAPSRPAPTSANSAIACGPGARPGTQHDRAPHL
jgi:hypothetical protein